jgi:hypothetical protein
MQNADANHKIKNMEEEMNNKNFNEKRLSIIFWGLLLIWWGLRWSVLISLPEGSGFLGTSFIFLGANLARRINGLPTLRDNTFFGLLTLLAGGILFVFAILHTPFQPPVFQTIIITLGVLFLGYALTSTGKAKMRVP